MSLYESIDTVGWDALDLPRDSANSIPTYLRMVYQTRQQPALHMLYNHTLHGSGIHPVMLVLMPFLLDMLNQPNRHIDGMLLDLIQRYLARRVTATDSQPDLVAALEAAAHQGLTRITALCQDPRPDVRQKAFATLCQFSAASDPSIPATIVQIATSEADYSVRLAMTKTLIARLEQATLHPAPAEHEALPTLLHTLLQPSAPPSARAFAATRLPHFQADVTGLDLSAILVDVLAYDGALSEMVWWHIPTAERHAILLAALLHATSISAMCDLALALAMLADKGEAVEPIVVQILASLLQQAGRDFSSSSQLLRSLHSLDPIAARVALWYAQPNTPRSSYERRVRKEINDIARTLLDWVLSGRYVEEYRDRSTGIRDLNTVDWAPTAETLDYYVKAKVLRLDGGVELIKPQGKAQYVLLGLLYDPAEEPLDVHTLTDEQRRALLKVIDDDAYWRTPTNLLARYGLPVKRDAARRLLLEPSGATDHDPHD